MPRSRSGRSGAASRRQMLVSAAALLAIFVAWLPAHPLAQVGQAPALRPGGTVNLWAGPPGPPSLVTSPIAERIRAGGPRIESSSFLPTYSGFTAEAQAAFQFAVNVWAAQLTSPVPIRVEANWTDLCTPNGYPSGCGILGSAGPATFYRSATGMPRMDTWYAAPLANALVGYDLDQSSHDIEANFNSTWANWYFGLDGRPPSGQIDFVSVVLHELGHGLGFLGMAAYDAGTGEGAIGYGGYPSAWDRFAANGGGVALLNFVNPSADLGAQLIGNSLYWNGPHGVAGAGGAFPRLYAPTTWAGGSSYSHLDEATYPRGTANSLMTPSIGGGEAIHDPGPIALGMLRDTGWQLDTTPTRVIALSGSLTFGDVLVNTTATRTLRIGNSGNSTLTVTGIIYPAGFSGTWTGSIAPGSWHDVTVAFAPTATVAYGGTITVNSDRTSGTNTTTASGTGTAVLPTRVIGLSGSLSFGTVTVNSTATRVLRISNTGNSTLTVTGISYPSGFSGTWAGSIAAGSSRDVTVTFAPTAAVAYGGTVTVDSDGTSGTNTIAASGAGTVPDDVVISFPGHGTWFSSWGAGAWRWREIHGLDFGPLATGDFDGNGTDDLVAYVAGSGVWVRYDNGTWRSLHVLRPDSIVTGDLDANGRADIVFDFGPSGLWRWMNNGTWAGLHWLNPGTMATGDFDGNGRSDLMVTFAGSGVWIYYNNTTWFELHGLAPEMIVTGDFDGDGRADAALDFGAPHGLYLWLNQGTWVSLHALSPGPMAAGDSDGDRASELVLGFPGAGLYTWDLATGWRNLHWLDAESMATADVDGDGRADAIIDFGPSGVWARVNEATWSSVHGLDGGAMATGRLVR